MLTGSLVAIATPMHSGGALDLPALAKLIDFHVANGTSGIVIVGTTGESPTVSFDEHRLLIKTALEYAAGRIPVIAGTGANSTAEAVELAAYAAQSGAHSHLSVVPYYNRPTQEGLYRHFRATRISPSRHTDAIAMGRALCSSDCPGDTGAGSGVRPWPARVVLRRARGGGASGRP
jgi:dihydrodipicolinate synthase/N-acetylneuraminate lyase